MTIFLERYQLKLEEYFILLLSLVPHIQSNFLDAIIQQYLPNGDEFPEIGGVKGINSRSTQPTGETALFILAGEDIPKRLLVSNYFSPNHFFAEENILHLEPAREGEPSMNGRIIMQKEYIDFFTTGVLSKPSFSPDFPAKRVTTKMEWEDLVLNPKTAQSIDMIKTWLHYNDNLLNDWGMDKKIKPG